MDFDWSWRTRPVPRAGRPPPPPSPAPPPLSDSTEATTSTLGPCEATSFESDCDLDRKGAWQAADLRECVSRCRHCSGCAFVSYAESSKDHDCSWFSECAGSSGSHEGYSRQKWESYRTYRVRSVASGAATCKALLKAIPPKEERTAEQAAQHKKLKQEALRLKEALS